VFGFLQKLLSRAVVVALDSDTDGEKMAQKILAQLPYQAVRRNSKAKDWNEDLKKDLELALQPKRCVYSIADTRGKIASKTYLVSSFATAKS
jgi:hypothetical protein